MVYLENLVNDVLIKHVHKMEHQPQGQYLKERIMIKLLTEKEKTNLVHYQSEISKVYHHLSIESFLQKHFVVE